jgi:hypothetical protein
VSAAKCLLSVKKYEISVARLRRLVKKYLVAIEDIRHKFQEETRITESNDVLQSIPVVPIEIANLKTRIGNRKGIQTTWNPTILFFVSLLKAL